MDESSREIFAQVLRDGAAALSVPLGDQQIAACARYADLLIEANARTNLTRITEPAAMASLHFVDSLSVLVVYPDLPHGAMVADVGTGAGFPGLPLKIIRPDLRLILIDSLAKRLAFLAEVVRELGLDDVALVHARAEDAGRDPAHRDRCDLAVARAVAALPTLLEWCAPLVRPGGRLIAMKASGVDAELAASATALRALRVRLVEDRALDLPPPNPAEPVRRRLLVLEKSAPTPPRFPRRPAEIRSSPL